MNIPKNIHAENKYIDIEDEVNKILEKRIRSSFIYPIDQLEQILGELWGEFKEEHEELTDQEKEIEKRFLEWRKKILDFGNFQMRLARNEIRKVMQ